MLLVVLDARERKRLVDLGHDAGNEVLAGFVVHEQVFGGPLLEVVVLLAESEGLHVVCG